MKVQILKLIKEAIKKENCNNICLSGGFALNCVNNYFIRKNLPSNINLYIEPLSHDAGTSIGAAKLLYYSKSKDNTICKQTSVYYGIQYNLKEIKEN